MKQKIKEALRQEYKSRLELDDDRLDGVAAFASTFVTDESKIEEFVKNEATLAMLKSYQSVLDKDRAKRKANPEPKDQPSDNGNQSPEVKPEDDKVPAWAQQLLEQNKALAEQNKSFAEKLSAFETAKTAEIAVKQAQEKFGADEWVNGYPELRDSAWAQAMRIYDRTGKSMTADELHTEAMEIFKPLAKAKGLDISKPFQSDGASGGDNQSRFEAMAKRQQERQGAVAE